MLIFDIGYHTGEFSRQYIIEYPYCNVIAIEANPDLCKNTPPPNVTLLNRVASQHNNQPIDFFVSPQTPAVSTAAVKFMSGSRFVMGSNVLAPHHSNWNPPIKIQSVTIDNLVETYGEPDLIKIDIEGYEYEALLGLSTIQKEVCFEWHEEFEDQLILCIEHLQGLGYINFGIVGFFQEGRGVFKNLTFVESYEDHLAKPQQYMDWITLSSEVFCDQNRRVNWGMCYARK